MDNDDYVTDDNSIMTVKTTVVMSKIVTTAKISTTTKPPLMITTVKKVITETYGYTTVTMSPLQISEAEKYESVPWESRMKGWNPKSGNPPVFTELPENTTVYTF
jgi:hypothetical protein